ncbi:MAG: hypothetical protein COA52_00780 [Hyphomicrobiales bacterium]|nr:MAG: hypothetical protein COA52_00780 [Hyphomicrobiales bacterium]
MLTGSSTEFLSANSNTTQSAILTVNSISFGGTYLKDVGNNITYNGDIIWTANNDGNGSGLDADLLGGFNSNTYLRTGTNISVANVTISGSLSANGSIGANGAVLYSNGTVSYWDILSVQGGAGYYKGNDGAIGDANNVNNIFRINTNELNANVTFANNENASATGPIVLGASVTMTIETGARVVIL